MFLGWKWDKMGRKVKNGFNIFLFLILSSIFIIGCSSNSNSYSPSSSNPSTKPIQESAESNVEVKPIGNNFQNIQFMYYERDNQYYYDIIHSINPEFMEGIKIIEIYNPEKTSYYWRGLYVPPDKIKINDYKGNFKYQLLHELIHNYCYHTNNNDLKHSYCFYHNPMQDSYRGELGIICGDNKCEN